MTDIGGPDQKSLINYVYWGLTTDHEVVSFVRELVSTVGAVLLVGLILFSVSGIWPPMVAVESGSMQPEMYRGDLIYVVDEHRFTAEFAYEETGVVTYHLGEQQEYHTFNSHGDVIIYIPDGKSAKTPIIHRAQFWVNDSENWYAKADHEYIIGDSCSEILNCPAPHSGFITKGDANGYYDQVKGISRPVRPNWIIGTAKIRVPYLGHIRLAIT